jgi:hypothetical protein
MNKRKSMIKKNRVRSKKIEYDQKKEYAQKKI